MDWSGVLATGARRLAAPLTYVVLVIGVAAGVVLPYVVAVVVTAVDESTPAGPLGVIGALWAFAVWVWVTGAIATAAAESRPMPFAQLVRRTFAAYGDYLVVALVFLATEIVAGIAVFVISLLGLGGRGSSTVLGVVSPLLVVGAGLVVAAVAVLHNLAIGFVAARRFAAVPAISAAWSLVRSRFSDVVLWVALTAASVLGLGVGLALPILSGAAGSVVIAFHSLADGAAQDSSSTTGLTHVLDNYVVAGSLILLAFFALAGVVVGALRCFTIGSAVGFVQPATPQLSRDRSAARAKFCERCGASTDHGARFCDSCGQVLVSG